MSDQTSIVDELQRFSPKIAAAGNLPSLVSVERIARDTRFRPSTLYIGYQSEVQERISRIQQAALYLIEDMPQFSLPYEHSNEVVFFPAQTDPAELMEECRGAMARLASLASKSLTLLDCMCRTDDLRRMADTAAQLIQNPFIVLDISYKVLGYSENYRVEDYQWQQNIKRGYCSFEYIGGFNRIDGVRAAPDSNEPFIVECFTSPLRRYITKLYLDGRQLGYAIAIEAVTPFSQTDPQLLVLISNFLARAIDNHHKLAQNVNNRMYDSVLIDCLEGNFKSRSAFQERISQTGIRMDSVYRLLLVNIGSYNNFDPGTEHLRQLINRLFGRSWIVCYNNSIVVLVDVQKRDFDILAVLKTERGTFGRYQLRVGVSDACSDLCEITAITRRPCPPSISPKSSRRTSAFRCTTTTSSTIW